MFTAVRFRAVKVNSVEKQKMFGRVATEILSRARFVIAFKPVHSAGHRFGSDLHASFSGGVSDCSSVRRNCHRRRIQRV